MPPVWWRVSSIPDSRARLSQNPPHRRGRCPGGGLEREDSLPVVQVSRLIKVDLGPWFVSNYVHEEVNNGLDPKKKIFNLYFQIKILLEIKTTRKRKTESKERKGSGVSAKCRALCRRQGCLKLRPRTPRSPPALETQFSLLPEQAPSVNLNVKGKREEIKQVSTIQISAAPHHAVSGVLRVTSGLQFSIPARLASPSLSLSSRMPSLFPSLWDPRTPSCQAPCISCLAAHGEEGTQ